MATTSTLERIGFVLDRYKDGGEQFIDLLQRVKKALETSTMERVPAEQIRRYKNQPRKYFDPDKIKSMSDSIDVTVQIQAGMIRKLPRAQWEPPVRYELIDGERRWRGVCMIPTERRPLYKAEVIDADDEVVQFLIAGMANFNREGHQPLETADTIDRYRKFGIPMEAIADLLGISVGWAYNIHGLLKLPDEVKDMLKPKEKKVEKGGKEPVNAKQAPQIPVAAAVHISKLPDPKRQIELAQKVVRGDINVTHIRGEVIRNAKEVDAPIRLREISPMKKWALRENKIGAILRFGTDLDVMLATQETQNIMGAHPKETSELLKQIRQAIGKLNRCDTHILKAQKK